ncbi:hypothetical protein COEREDRAFT_79973 [Coemansia reversa NRRL 1564]|uniref:RRM domain-containing protein n=1 Tax=Coemansia reversa (strain ATCC 12441 / NRRL 1564) TaxID=763665 RepID=A0A2G5BG73_COERN|nr:hypothetical protein COEREDRAFT_79973 [Coemansia reversa NRRL 1564]|eukprot:PIA18024.1 hypothetical protein COEREDRAFT_79973 [Coemansia reversa NRRL 1564]
MAYPTPFALQKQSSDVYLAYGNAVPQDAAGSVEPGLIGTGGMRAPVLAHSSSQNHLAASQPHAGVATSAYYTVSSAAHQMAPMFASAATGGVSAIASPAQGHYQVHAQHAMGGAGGAPVQLWMGDIESWMDESYIRRIWAHMGEMVVVKMIRDRLTGGAANYCFLELPNQAEADRMMALYNGKAMPQPLDRAFRLNWAAGPTGASLLPMSLESGGVSEGLTFSGGAVQTPAAVASDSASGDLAFPGGVMKMPTAACGMGESTEYSLFVGDLAPEVTDVQLAQEFRCRYASVRTAKVVTDPVTQLARGYGFVRFSDEADHQRALVEMQGHMIGTRAIRVSTATPKRTTTNTAHGDAAGGRDATRSPASSESSTDSNALYNPATDPFNTTVFVGGLMNPVGEDELHAFFAVYGEVVYCKIPPNRGCGFVTFAKRANAETAMRALNGHMLGGSRVRLSWGRSQSHARHNYRHRHGNARNHHAPHNRSGSGSAATSHRNSLSEQPGLYSRRSVSFGKPNVSAPPASIASAGLGLGLSGTAIPSGQSVAAPGKSALPPQQHSLASLDPVLSGFVSAPQPSPGLLGGGYLSTPLTQNHPPQPNEHGLVPHSAFYALSPSHHMASTMDAFGADAMPLGQTLAPHLQQQQQQQLYFYPYQQSAMPIHGSNAQLDGACQLTQDSRETTSILGNGTGVSSLTGGPGELLTRRLSALTLNSNNGTGSSAISSMRTGSVSGDAQRPKLDRRPSAGVIGQRRLSSKPSFGQQLSAAPQKTQSQLSLSQMWPQSFALGDACAVPPNDYHATLSTPASSARLSTSSLSMLALPPNAKDIGDGSRGSSARPSIDEQFKRYSR